MLYDSQYSDIDIYAWLSFKIVLKNLNTLRQPYVNYPSFMLKTEVSPNLIFHTLIDYVSICVISSVS